MKFQESSREDEKTKLNSDSDLIVMNSKKIRKIEIRKESPQKFNSNLVFTAHYSIFSALPLTVFNQFFSFLNVYYLIFTVLAFQYFSPISPWTILSPFAVTILFTSFKKIIEDKYRHELDLKINRAKVFKYFYSLKNFYEIENEKIKVGDILQISNNDYLPADLVLISSSNKKGIAYLDEKYIYGQSDYHEKIVNHLTSNVIDEKDLDIFDAEIYISNPAKELSTWSCNLKINDLIEPITEKQFIKKGSILRNTEWIYGVVVYAGKECQFGYESSKIKKFSNTQKTLNRIIITVFLFLLIVACIYGGLGKSWQDNNQNVVVYIENLPESDLLSVIYKILVYFISYSDIVPILILMLIEILRLFFAYFIENDLSMHDSDSNMVPKVNSSDLIEDLGQVKFIFTDKTGTLTDSYSIFQRFSTSKKDYEIDNIDNFNIDSIFQTNNKEFESINVLFRAILLCNTSFSQVINEKLVITSSFNDEVSLLNKIETYNYRLISKSQEKIILQIRGIQEEWKVLAELAFTSERRRMSAILCNESLELYLFTKGSDDVMLPLLSSDTDLSLLQEKINVYTSKGLRTLVIGGRPLTSAEYLKWQIEWKNALLGFGNKEILIDEIFKKLEKNLMFYGITGIEEKLQSDVKETIKDLCDAGIKVWMVTGDKEENAINIAKKSELIAQDCNVVEVFENSYEAVLKIFRDLDEKFNFSHKKYLELEDFKAPEKFSLVVNGIAFTYIFSDRGLQKLFFKFAFISQACICARMLPHQKSDLLKICKSQGQWITLSIGDGLNDVKMLRESHISINLSQNSSPIISSVSSYSDIKITQFSHLRTLLFVHGRYSYIRIGKFILYYFYKNFLIQFSAGWFSIFNGFSGQSFYLEYLPLFFDLFWTSWLILFFALFEQDFSPDLCLLYPWLYGIGIKNKILNLKEFWLHIFFAFYAGSAVFWLPIFFIGEGASDDGIDPGLFWLSTLSLIVMVHVSFLKIFMNFQYLNAFSL